MGKMHQDIKDLFPNAMYFGFTGTPEIKEIGDVVTVLKDGTDVGTREIKNVNIIP